MATVATRRPRFRCTQCGDPAPKWAGRCTACGEWNSLSEEGAERADTRSLTPSSPAQPMSAIEASDAVPLSTGLTELDRVLSGGLVAGSVTLIGGDAVAHARAARHDPVSAPAASMKIGLIIMLTIPSIR